jgi:hypothetical protein
MRDPDSVPIYQAPLRPRISPAFADVLRQALGNRDFSKSERGYLQEILVSMRAQADHLGHPSMPARDGDYPELLALKKVRLDGLWRAVQDCPHAFSDVERELAPLLLQEACTDFRPTARHLRAVPTHVVEAQRARAGEAPSAGAAELAELRGRIDGQDAKLDAILGHLSSLAAPSAAAPEKAAPSDSPIIVEKSDKKRH